MNRPMDLDEFFRLGGAGMILAVIFWMMLCIIHFIESPHAMLIFICGNVVIMTIFVICLVIKIEVIDKRWEEKEGERWR